LIFQIFRCTAKSLISKNLSPVHAANKIDRFLKGLKSPTRRDGFCSLTFRKIPMLGQKMLVIKNVLLGEFSRTRWPGHVRSLEKVAQRSTVALVVVREIVDRSCARCRDLPIKLRNKSASTKRPFHLQHVANLKLLE
jgi:hypothetical protein